MRAHRKTRSGNRRATALTVLVAGALPAALSPGAAGARDPAEAATEELSIRDVDVAQFPDVRLELLRVGPSPDPGEIGLHENGHPVGGARVEPIDTSHTPAAIVLTIDTSGSMRGAGAIDQVKAAARDFVGRRHPTDHIALVAYSDEPRLVSDFSSDTAQLVGAVDSLDAGGNTALWDAVVLASSRLATRRDAQRFLIVLSDASADSYDNSSTSTPADARDAAGDAGATVFTVGLPSGPVDETEYRALATSTGGIHLTTTDVTEVGGIFSRIQGSIRNQYEITYRSAATTPELALVVTAGGARAATTVQVPGLVAEDPAPAGDPAPLKDVGDGYHGPPWQIFAVLWVVLAAGLARWLRPRRPRGGSLVPAGFPSRGRPVRGAPLRHSPRRRVPLRHAARRRA